MKGVIAFRSPAVSYAGLVTLGVLRQQYPVTVPELIARVSLQAVHRYGESAGVEIGLINRVSDRAAVLKSQLLNRSRDGAYLYVDRHKFLLVLFIPQKVQSPCLLRGQMR